jgi:hypothetical protein
MTIEELVRKYGTHTISAWLRQTADFAEYDQQPIAREMADDLQSALESTVPSAEEVTFGPIEDEESQSYFDRYIAGDR